MSPTSWTVEVDADPDMTGLFIIDESLLGGSHLLAPTERWIAIPWEHVLSISIRRGGSGSSRAYDAGECVVELDNATGDYDPDNPYGFYVMGPRRLLTQGTGLRVKAFSTATATVFTGYIEDPTVGGHWTAPTATFTCTDFLGQLGAVDVPEQGEIVGAGVTGSTRAHWLLDQGQVPTTKRSIEAGGRTVLGTAGTGTVRHGLEQIAYGEAGRFFVTRAGVVTLSWHESEYGKTPLVNYSNTGAGPKYVSVVTSPGIVGIINSATVKRAAPQVLNELTGELETGPAFRDLVSEDPDSVASYRRRSISVDVVLQDEADAQSLATYLAERRSQPTPRIESLVSVPLEVMTAAQAQLVLQLELGDMITLTQTTIDEREIFWTATVEQITFDRSSPTTRVSFSTAPTDLAPIYGGTGWFKVGTSLLAGPDVLAPYYF